LLSKACNFTDFLEIDDRARLITVNTDTCRIVSTVLLAGETCNEDFKDLFS
jgi:hypothetical protein